MSTTNYQTIIRGIREFKKIEYLTFFKQPIQNHYFNVSPLILNIHEQLSQ